jgi:hypothetical protein
MIQGHELSELRAGVLLIYATALAPGPAPHAAPAARVVTTTGITVIAVPRSLPNSGPFPQSFGGPVPAWYVPPAALAGYSFRAVSGPAILPPLPPGFYVIPVNLGLTALVEEGSALFRAAAAAEALAVQAPSPQPPAQG